MNQRIPGILLLSLLLGSVAFLHGDDNADEAPEKVRDSPYYPLAIGTTWTYLAGGKEVVIRVTAHEKVGDTLCALIESSRGGKVQAQEHIAAKEDGVYRYAIQGLFISPPLHILKLPPRKDESWKVDSKVGRALTVKGEFVCREMDVKINDTTYKTVTVVTRDLKEGDQKVNLSASYAEGVGMVKLVNKEGAAEVILELKKYEPGK